MTNKKLRLPLPIFLFTTLVILLSSCDATKYLQEDELLYSGTTVEFQNPKRVNKKAQIQTDLELIAQPKVNTSGFKVWVYNKFKKEKGISGFIRKRLGEPATLYNEDIVNRSQLVMKKYLHDRGYFNAEVEYDTIVDKKKALVNYTVISKGQYKIRNISLPADTLNMGLLIRNNQNKTKLKKGNYYNIADLEAERLRLNEIAKNTGFYDFNPDYLYYFVDTTAGNLQTDLFLKVKAPEFYATHPQYHMGEVHVYPNYSLNQTSGLEFQDTVKTDRLTVYQNETFIRPSVLEESIAQVEGELFSERRQEQTVNHLLDLGVFKFVNLKYQLRQTLSDSLLYLDRYIYLTPSLTRDFSVGLEFSTDNSRNLGSTVTTTYVNRNLFRGAERLNLSLSVGAETQSGASTFINTLDINAQAELVFPRFLTPFGVIPNSSSFFVPRTRITLSENYQQRPENYILNSAQLRYTFDWRETTFKRHELTVFNLNLVNLLSTQPKFDSLLMTNRRLAASFDDVLILGFGYRYTYSDQEVNTLKNYMFWQTRAETSGNIVQGVKNLLGNSEKDPKEILGLPYSQFFKIETDIRYNILNKSNSIVGRLNLGVGIPYGNSKFLPYIKQFYSGGANSVRAFRIRELGPGASPKDNNDEGANTFFDQTGDVKIEMNLEYRFDILPAFYLKGAAFLDAGNVWLITDPDNENPQGLFDFSTFYKELAVGTGLGLRLDISFIVLRFDVAFPIRKPSRPDGDRWTFEDIALGNRQWRQDNLNFNIAIGYPF